MDWSAEALYGKARVYVHQAHDEPIDSSLFAFWMSLALELLCRAALAKIHPVLLADPMNEGNIQYAFGIIPKINPKSVHAKTVFARCSVFIPNFTDKMSAHCLIVADRRNSELHTGAAAFESLDNSAWLPSTYEAIEILLGHLGNQLEDFLGEEHASTAKQMLKSRRKNLKKEVFDRIATAKRAFKALSDEQKEKKRSEGEASLEKWTSAKPFRRACTCPACGSKAAMTGEALSRGPVRIDEDEIKIRREVRVLPNTLGCPSCRLRLSGFQEMLEAGVGTIYTVVEEEDPIEFFGIDPEEHVDIDDLIQRHIDNDYGYMNE